MNDDERASSDVANTSIIPHPVCGVCVPVYPAQNNTLPVTNNHTNNRDAVDLQQRLHDAHATIAHLHAEADAQAHSNYEVAEHLRQQLASKNQQLMELEMRLTQV